jgi:hypothetical protein
MDGFITCLFFKLYDIDWLDAAVWLASNLDQIPVWAEVRVQAYACV